MQNKVFRDIQYYPSAHKKACHIFDANFKYIPSIKTDIVKRFRKMGWVPPSETRSLK